MALRTIAKYSTILEVNRVAITEPSLDEIFEGTSAAVRNVLPYDRMGLSLYTPEHKALRLTAATGQGSASFYQVGIMLDCEETHHGWVFQNQKPIVRRNLVNELEFQAEQYNVQEGIRSYCAVPLIVRSESIGVIIVLSSHRNNYSDAHAGFLQQVADQFALAVRSLIPTCPKHSQSKLVCPRCIASGGGQATAAKHKRQLSDWGKQGGRGRKKPVSGFEPESV